ncbi:hypothetical protein B0H14DRAFT_3757982 [Mycena olivaceomarginata]|nr:hypothetical protein B0H14DRAFT_3757982 [Mycena olivaceomarginata]
MLHRMGRNVQRKSNSVANHRTTTQKTAEADELQARVDAAKAAKKASSSGRVLSPRCTPQKELVSVTATVPPLPFIDPLPAPALTPLDFTLPFDFGDDLAWLENLGFISETSQPLDASSNNVSLANTVPNNNPGGTELQYDGTGELDWLFSNVIQGGGHFVAPSSQLDWNANGPDLLDPSSAGAGGIVFEGWDADTVSTQSELPILLPPPSSSPFSFPAALQVISPPPHRGLECDVDERNILHFSRTHPTKRALETVGTAVQSRAKKAEE